MDFDWLDQTRIVSYRTKMGEWCIFTEHATFEITTATSGFTYYLTNDRFLDFVRTSENLYHLIRFVARRQTGLRAWDTSTLTVSEAVYDWTLEIDKDFKMELARSYLRSLGDIAAVRQMVEYFERKHVYCMDRTVVNQCLKKLIALGELPKLPNMAWAQAEMHNLKRIWRRHQQSRE